MFNSNLTHFSKWSQVWKYNPKMLSTEGVVDKLSLYLSLKDNDDERIQIELERLINEMSW